MQKLDATKIGVHTGRLVPIYHETYGVSSKWIRSRIAKTLPVVSDQVEEFLPNSALQSLKLSDLKKAITTIHYPKTQEEADIARKRLAFNELLFLQLQSQ